MEIPEQLAAAPLAYENKEFLNSPDGRILRILSEYSEPLARFRKERIQDTVVFFGSARFASLSSAQGDLALLEKPGSATPAPPEEQPAPLDEAIADEEELNAITGADARRGVSLNLQRARA